MRTNEIKNEIYEIKNWENKIKREDLIYKTNKYKYDFQQYKTLRSLGEYIYSGKVNINDAEKDQCNLLKKFNDKSRPRTKKVKIIQK